MLETPCIRRYSFMSHPVHTMGDMSSENPYGADNQQERPGIEQWIVGFTDGEGCFSISVVRNPTCSLGWQVQHEFSVTQSAGSLEALELLVGFFGCGYVIANRRTDSRREPLMRYAVKRRADLIERIIPFFEKHPLITTKREDFALFCRAMDRISQRAHLSREGMMDIARITEQMNRKNRSRFLESSEAIRQPPRHDV